MNKKSFDFTQDHRPALHALILLVATGIPLVWVNIESLNYYSLQLTALLLLTLIISHHLLKPATFHLVESTVSTIAVLLVVTSTGGIASPFFFLNYFLLFELSLLLEPVIPLVLSGALVLFYLNFGQAGLSGISWLGLLAFPFITPLAFYFGQIYQKEKNQKKETHNLSKKIEKLEEELVEEEII